MEHLESIQNVRVPIPTSYKLDNFTIFKRCLLGDTPQTQFGLETGSALAEKTGTTTYVPDCDHHAEPHSLFQMYLNHTLSWSSFRTTWSSSISSVPDSPASKALTPWT
ncbi:unnamed protein product [Nesidiocoris tenuis]|uniref:Uncharacterized protein n=1 Tax=Nesidiocoris tenuis TaxID=355587 RepID=A0A6H5G074_9HEMI|nr:unnamed protein product [Nesidiocoris tenuis]